MAYTPEFAALAKVQSGELVQVLQDYAWESQTVSLAQLAGRVIPRKLVALVDFALEDAKTHSGLDQLARKLMSATDWTSSSPHMTKVVALPLFLA